MSYDLDGRPKKEQQERHKVKYIPIGDDNKPKDDKGNVELTPKSKHGGSSEYPPFVRTLPTKKRRRPGELSDDDKQDVRRYFGASDGVSIVDEREYTYDGGGFH